MRSLTVAKAVIWISSVGDKLGHKASGDTMSLTLAFATLASVVAIVGGLAMLFFRQFRRYGGPVAFAGCVCLVYVSHFHAQSVDTEARTVGFLSAADQKVTQGAGVHDPGVWRQRQKDAAEESERNTAQAAGFKSVEEYRTAALYGATTKAAYDQKLREQAFFVAPEEQRRVVSAIEEARKSFRASQNDLAKGGTRHQRRAAMCGALRTRAVRGWVGTLHQLSSNSDGKGVVSIQIGRDVYVKTWNNAFSDISHRTLIDPSSPLFGRLASLKQGQQVKFSGQLFDSDVDCFAEGSITLAGSMETPEFIIRVLSIETP